MFFFMEVNDLQMILSRDSLSVYYPANPKNCEWQPRKENETPFDTWENEKKTILSKCVPSGRKVRLSLYLKVGGTEKLVRTGGVKNLDRGFWKSHKVY